MATGSTSLCTEENNPCPAARVYTGHIEAFSKNAVLLGKFFGFTASLSCGESTILGNALGLANLQVTHLELLDFTGCTSTIGEKCTVTVSELGLVDLLRTAANLGTSTSLNSKVHVVCAGIP
jgi:hypothetical protein